MSAFWTNTNALLRCGAESTVVFCNGIPGSNIVSGFEATVVWTTLDCLDWPVPMLAGLTLPVWTGVGRSASLVDFLRLHNTSSGGGVPCNAKQGDLKRVYSRRDRLRARYSCYIDQNS